MVFVHGTGSPCMLAFTQPAGENHDGGMEHIYLVMNDGGGSRKAR